MGTETLTLTGEMLERSETVGAEDWHGEEKGGALECVREHRRQLQAVSSTEEKRWNPCVLSSEGSQKTSSRNQVS